jgi:hypothetical protein
MPVYPLAFGAAHITIGNPPRGTHFITSNMDPLDLFERSAIRDVREVAADTIAAKHRLYNQPAFPVARTAQ